MCVYLYCISSRVLCSHVVSVSQERSGQLSQNLVGEVGIIHPTLRREKQILITNQTNTWLPYLHVHLWSSLAYHEGVAVTMRVCVRQVQTSGVHGPQLPQTLPTEEPSLRG